VILIFLEEEMNPSVRPYWNYVYDFLVMQNKELLNALVRWSQEFILLNGMGALEHLVMHVTDVSAEG
jgi:hypothetical protein